MSNLAANIKLFRRNSIFFKVLAFFVLTILLSVLMVGALSYAYSSDLLHKEVVNSNMLLLEQAQNSNDQLLNNVDAVMNQLLSNNDILAGLHLTSNREPEEILKLDRINNILTAVVASNKIISDIAIHYTKSDIVVTNGAFYDFDLFFDKFHVIEGLQKQELREVFSKCQAFHSLGNFIIRNDYTAKRHVCYIKTLYFSSKGTYGTILITVDEQLFRNLLAETSKNNGSLLSILDPDGRLISSNNPQVSHEVFKDIYYKVSSSELVRSSFRRVVENKAYDVEWIKSEKTGWYYIAEIPEAQILQKVYIIRNIAAIIVIITLFLAWVVAYFLSARIYKPVASLLDYLKREEKMDLNTIVGEKRDELGYIADLLDETLYNNRQLSGMIDRSKPILLEKVINDLLDGKYSNKTKEVMQSVQFEMKEGIFQVIIFDIEDLNMNEFYQTYEETSKETFDVISMFDALTPMMERNKIRVYCLQKRPDKVITLLNMDPIDENHDYINEFIRHVIDSFHDMHNRLVTAGVGNAYKELQKIPDSYIDAMFALKYKVIKGSGTVIYADEVKGVPENLFEYPMEMEIKLVNFTKAGDKSNASNVIERIIETNMNKKGVSPEMLDNLFSTLIGTAIRTVYSMQSTMEEIFGATSNLYLKLDQCKTIEEKKRYLTSVFSKICEFVNNSSKNRYEKTYTKILEYIKENYAREISLDIIGEALDLSPSYISWVFKEQSGENLTNYLNSVRIEKAVEFLRNESIAVKEAGEMVGFNSIHTFIRVFKKLKGITPGQFKESYSEGNEDK